MSNTKKLETVKELVNKIVLAIGTISKRTGTDEERAKLNEALSFSEAFLKEEEPEEEDDYQSSDAYYDSNC